MTERVYRIGGASGSRPPSFLDDLNDEQRAAASAPDGAILVIAGAGSGKTRTLAYRVAWLMSRGIPPERVLLLTFTNRAAREMLARVEALLGGAARRVVGGTFHHVGNVLLRRHAAAVGYGPGYSIIDPADAQDLIRSVVAELGVSGPKRRFPRPDHIHRALSHSVNTGRPLAQVFGERYPHFVDHVAVVERVCTRFVERKVEADLMDFDDLLLGWKLLLDGDPAVAREVTGRFTHVLVDEYQDTNRLQGELVDAMAADHGNVTVVGDDCQSIYSFRGASFENIIGFPERYPAARVFRLTRNYRSTPQVLALANRSIAHNEQQFDKVLRPERGDGDLPAVVPCADARQQAAFVAHRVLELREQGTPLSEMAVLYRAHRHAAELEVELRNRRIPYVVRSGVRFFEQAHVKDVLAYLRIVANPRDELAWFRVLRLQPGIGGKTAYRIIRSFAGEGDPMAAVAGGASPGGLPRRAAASWQRLCSALARMCGPDLMQAPAALLDHVLATGYEDHLKDRHGDAGRRLEDIRQIAGFAAGFDGVGPFLDEVSGVTDVTGQGFRTAPEGDDEWLVLSTVHQAKGLEWQSVFVLAMADGLFPLPVAMRSERELEESRRLFYVAVTRARSDLHLVYPVFGTDRGYRQVVHNASRFVVELQGTPSVYETWRIDEEVGAPAP